MTSRRYWSILVALFLLLSLFLVACVRPLPGDNVSSPAATLVDTGSDTQPETYPAPEAEDSAADAPADESYPPAGEGDDSSTELLQPADESETSPEGYPAAEGETVEGEHVEGETTEGEHAEGEAAEGEHVEGEAAEGEHVEGEAVEGEHVEGEAAESPEEIVTVETGRTHTVAPGETLFRIGMQYGMSWVTLAEANGLVSPNSLYIGQVLTIPDVETSEESDETAEGAAEEEVVETEEAEEVEATLAATSYVVQNGDTLYRISVQFGVSMMEIARENDLANFNQIYAGQELIIPQVETEEETGVGTAATESEEAAVTHLVEEGETVFTIAFKYGIAWTKLVEANEIASPYTLEAGQKLVIPAGEQ